MCGRWYEGVGGEDISLGVIPPGKGVEPNNKVVLDPDHGLVVELKFVVFEGFEKLAFEFELFDEVLTNFPLEQDRSVPTKFLRSIHGAIGISSQRFSTVIGSTEGDPDGDGD